MKKEKKMKRYLIDGENVNDVWVNLLDRMKEHDKIVIFYTKNSPHIDYEKVMSIMSMKPKQVKWVKCYDGTNALDFQLCTVLGSMIAKKPKAEYFIVSNDTGYDAAVSYWKKNGYKISRLKSTDCVPTKEKKEEEEDWTTSKRRMNPRRKRVDRHNRNGRKNRNNYYRNEETVMPTSAEETAATKAPELHAKSEEKKMQEPAASETAILEEKKPCQRKNNYRRGRFSKMGQGSTASPALPVSESARPAAKMGQESISSVSEEKPVMSNSTLAEVVPEEEKKEEQSGITEPVETASEISGETTLKAENAEEAQQEGRYNRRHQDSRRRNGNNRHQNGRHGRRWAKQEETDNEEITAEEKTPEAVQEEAVAVVGSELTKAPEEAEMEEEIPEEEPVIAEETSVTAEKLVEETDAIGAETTEEESAEEATEEEATEEEAAEEGSVAKESAAKEENAEETPAASEKNPGISSAVSIPGFKMITEEKEETWFRMKPEDLVEKQKPFFFAPEAVKKPEEVKKPVIIVEEILEFGDLQKQKAEQEIVNASAGRSEEAVLNTAEALQTISEPVESAEAPELTDVSTAEAVTNPVEESAAAEPAEEKAESSAVTEISEEKVEESEAAEQAEEKAESSAVVEVIEEKATAPAIEAPAETKQKRTRRGRKQKAEKTEAQVQSTKDSEEKEVKKDLEEKEAEETKQDLGELLKSKILEKAFCDEESCNQVIACVEQLSVSLSMTNRTLLHNALVAILGAEGGDVIYGILKSDPAFPALIKAKRQRRKNERIKNYIALILSVSEMPEMDAEELFEFYQSVSTEELQKIYEECQKKFGQEKGNNYYQILKKHYRILQRI